VIEEFGSASANRELDATIGADRVPVAPGADRVPATRAEPANQPAGLG
jgi:hypothetical protein